MAAVGGARLMSTGMGSSERRAAAQGRPSSPAASRRCQLRTLDQRAVAGTLRRDHPHLHSRRPQLFCFSGPRLPRVSLRLIYAKDLGLRLTLEGGLS